MLLEPGRVCIKKYGRDAGSKAVIVAVEKNGFVRIASAGRKKERMANVKHLEFLNETIDIKDKEKVDRVLGVQRSDKKA
jgi:ribosomal protein L14E/L6E/L27E